VNEDRWPLGFLLSPAQVVAALLRSTPPETLVRIDNGLPDDVRFVRMYVDNASQRLCVVLDHPSFKGVYDQYGGTRWADGEPLLFGLAPHATRYTGPEVAAVLAAATG
jgi:hypothetical protein